MHGQPTPPWPELPEGARHIGTYERRLRATPELVWRNVLDFEHLPHLHAHAFARVLPLAMGPDWWRCRLTLAPARLEREMVLELIVDRDRLRYVARTIAGVSLGTTVITQLEPDPPDHTSIKVDFWAPGLDGRGAALRQRGYFALYRRLWDEDQAMIDGMIAARAQPPWQPQPRTHLAIVDGRTVTDGIRMLGMVTSGSDSEQVWIHEPFCPHMGGPLTQASIDELGRLRCPWHGYTFDLHTGRCPQAPGLRLTCVPARRIDDDTLEI